MGYTCYIGREDPIDPAEWDKLLAEDSTLVRRSQVEGAVSGMKIKVVTDAIQWLGHPENESVYFSLTRGGLHAKNPDRASIQKLGEIARALRAVLYNDDGEQLERPLTGLRAPASASGEGRGPAT